MTKIRILGYDLGTNLGMGMIRDSLWTASSTRVLKGKNVESRGMRFIKAREIFKQDIEQFKPDIIAYESIKRFMSSDAGFVYNGILAQLLVVADELKMEYIGYAPTEIKKTATGNGRASKPEMIAWANKKYAIKVKDDNEADALAVCYHAYTNLVR